MPGQNRPSDRTIANQTNSMLSLDQSLNLSQTQSTKEDQTAPDILSLTRSLGPMTQPRQSDRSVAEQESRKLEKIVEQEADKQGLRILLKDIKQMKDNNIAKTEIDKLVKRFREDKKSL